MYPAADPGGGGGGVPPSQDNLIKNYKKDPELNHPFFDSRIKGAIH